MAELLAISLLVLLPTVLVLLFHSRSWRGEEKERV